jgi:hypothetical protein
MYGRKKSIGQPPEDIRVHVWRIGSGFLCVGIAFEPGKAAVVREQTTSGVRRFLISRDIQTVSRRAFNLHARADKVIITTATIASILTGRPNFEVPGKQASEVPGSHER